MKKKIALLLICVMVLSVFSGMSAFGTAAAVKTGITVVIPEFPTNLDPTGISGNKTNTTVLTPALFDPLVNVDAKGKIVPNLASKWVESPDRKQITFELRKDVTFHDGSKLTADDVIFSIQQRMKAPIGQGSGRFISKITKVDNYTLRIDRPTNFSKIYEQLSFMSVISKKAFLADPKGFDKNPIGSGAFKYLSVSPGQGYTLTANTKYFKGAPKLKTITVKVIASASTAVLALQTGEVDLIPVVFPTDIKTLSKDTKVAIKRTSTYMQYQFQMMKGGAIDNLKVRKAIYNAINTKNALMVGYENFGTPATDLYSRYVMGKFYNVTPLPKKSIDTAKALLKEAGYNSSDVITITVIDPTSLKVAQSCQNDLLSIGLNVKIEQLDMGAFYGKYMSGSLQIMLIPMGGANMAPEEVANLYTTTGDPFNSYTGKTAAYDTAVAKMLKETNATKKLAYMKTALTMLKNNYILVPLFETTAAMAYSKRVTGANLTPAAFIDYSIIGVK